MNKKIIFTGFMTGIIMVFLTACGVNNDWQEEDITINESDTIITEDVVVEWEIDENQSPEEGKVIRLQIINNDVPIDDFEVNHEKLLHLIIVSKDLSYFNHLHPEYKGKGVFEIENEFPFGGEYRMVADFKPANGSSMSKMAWLQVEGEEIDLHPIVVDNSLEKIVDRKKVTLFMEDELKAGKELTLKFNFIDESTNQPIADLEPYLGSIGHVVIFSETGDRYLHVHAVEDQGSGPDALFETTFPESGVYKIWGQFQKDGEVFTVSFVIEVP